MAPSSKALAIRRTDVTREEARNVNVGLSAALGLNLTELVVERAERDPAFATRLRRALGQHASLDEATLYGSREPYPAPPRRSRRWLRDHGPELVAFGAVRIGGKRGRGVVWTIPAEGLRRWDEAQATKPPTEAAASTAAGSSPRADVDAWIAQSGLRLTRRSA